MKTINFLGIMLCALFIISCEQDVHETTDVSENLISPKSAEGEIIADQFIVLWDHDEIKPALSYVSNDQFRSREEKAEVLEDKAIEVKNQIVDRLEKIGIIEEEILYYYTILDAGVALKISEDKFKLLQSLPNLKSLEYDRKVELPPFTIEEIVEDGNSRAQSTPCGINNAGGAVNANQSRWIWVVDTGIDLDHPDLNVITSSTYAKSYVGGSPNDCNGHGTHCAGTAAARNNSFGVIGVAANAPVVPIRVLNCSGSGSTSGIISGLNHIANYDLPGDVVNMSLGGYFGSGCASSSSYKSAIQSLGNAGTRVAIAAGNSSANAAFYQPACVNGTNIFTVSSMTCGKAWSSFSNYNMNPVDFIATGSSVYSTYKNGGYATLSGTSMATPHVAGICQVRNAKPRGVGTVTKFGENYPIAKR